MANIVIADPFNITISWTAPEEPNGDITHYIYTVTDTDTSALIIGDSTTETSIVDLPLTNVVPFTNYTVSVLAVNSAGNGEDSTITTVSPETGKVVGDRVHHTTTYLTSTYMFTNLTYVHKRN